MHCHKEALQFKITSTLCHGRTSAFTQVEAQILERLVKVEVLIRLLCSSKSKKVQAL